MGSDPPPPTTSLAPRQGDDQALSQCVFGVLQSVEHEEVFDADLNLIGHNEGAVGEVNGFAPPGDIHRVHNTSDEVAITLHIYGTDITRVGSSVRRYYDLPTER